jgi:hypothetical protein
LKTFVRVSLPRDEFAVAIPDVRQCPKAIVFQFEKEVRIIEGLTNEG